MADETFPIFDAHAHFSQAYLDQLLASYEQCGVAGGINLWWPDYHGAGDGDSHFADFLATLGRRGLSRFVPFYWPNWRAFGWQPERFVEILCADMRRYAAMGCAGLKVWKDLGMFIVHPDGTPATMDDERLEPVWSAAAELGWTVAVHQADPSPNWAAKTRTGLLREEVFRRRDRVLAAHADLRFILCHNANDIESVQAWADLLERMPNCLADLSRDPLRHDTLADVRAFLEAHADRILLGTDLLMPDDRPPDHEWNLENIYAPWRRRLLSFGLRDEVLHKITWGNGERLFLTGRG